MNLDEMKLTLGNERKFHDDYHKCANRAGSSIGPQRRKLIGDWVYACKGFYANMREQLELEKYFNERYELCPYGLPRSQEEDRAKRLPQPVEVTVLTEQQPKEKIMASTPTKIETKTFINGVDTANMSDETIFEIIRSTEDEIKGLEAIANKPKKLQAKIDAMNVSIKNLVEFVDARA